MQTVYSILYVVYNIELLYRFVVGNKMYIAFYMLYNMLYYNKSYSA